MEVSAMQTSGLRCLQSLQASTSSGGSRAFPRKVSVVGHSFVKAKSVSFWKRASDSELGQRSVRRASSGGTRRDQQKIVARTQRRRSRHVKGVTPTKDELMNQLAEEEDADVALEMSVADYEEAADDTDDFDEEDPVEDRTAENLDKYWETLGNILTENQGTNSDEGVKRNNASTDQSPPEDDSIPGSEEIIENDDNTITVRFIPEGGARKRENGVASAAGQASDVAEETVEGVSEAAQNAVGEAGENLQEAGNAVRENVDQASSVAEELSDTAQDTAQDVAATVQETAKDSGQSLSEAGDAIQEGVSAVGSQVGDVAREGADAVGEQLQVVQKEAQKNVSEVGSQAGEAGERAGGALEKIASEAGKSAELVGESLTSQVADAAGTAGVVGGEVLRIGEVAVNAVGEAAGFTEESSSETGSEAKQASEETPDTSGEEESKREVDDKKQESKSIDSKKKQQPGEAEKSEARGPYDGLKVTVAGATGRTGRLIVEELVSRGVPVTAMVRDPAKARDLDRVLNVDVVKADLYNYEAVKKAIGDSNVVICAIGASGLPFDPIGTYRTEFEGVKNLVAAAKNGGKVKKFVLISTIGVSFLQIVPLIFWKKQAELYLQRSGLDYTIIRPGGLKNGVDKSETVLMKSADTQFGGSITRRKVAELCIDAVITPEASEKVVEVVSGGRGGQTPAELFGKI
ncbi:hypothetical protein R1flu_012316 [Riccia fluitans]|uniref:NAD(P)-binding domain-containing protein n=1 Tax=Riccia fluitans TaxID=41844 RepID=A0ABD1ZAA4_9MARC